MIAVPKCNREQFEQRIRVDREGRSLRGGDLARREEAWAGEGRYPGREVDAAGRLSGASDHHSARGPQTGDPQVALSGR